LLLVIKRHQRYRVIGEEGGFCLYVIGEYLNLVPKPAPTVVPKPAPTVVPKPAPTVVPKPAPTIVPKSAPTIVPKSAPTIVPKSSFYLNRGLKLLPIAYSLFPLPTTKLIQQSLIITYYLLPFWTCQCGSQTPVSWGRKHL